MPPLNAVRAFVVVATHGSFTLAAAELGVTHGAVSRQVKALEEVLAVKLFVRGVRRITLTTAGRDFLAGAAPALERIGDAARAVSRSSSPRTVRINCRPSFAIRWLIPQLPRFLALHPEVEPQVSTTLLEPARVKRKTYDVIIRRAGMGSWPPGLRVRPFLSDHACLVAAPTLLATRPVRSMGDLEAHVFLHCATRDTDWHRWMQLNGVTRLPHVGDLRFEHLQFSLQAALDGMGLALGPASHIAFDVAAGRLRTILPEATLPLDPYCFALADDAATPAIAFADWIERML